MAIHFNNTPHLITDFSFICIEAVSVNQVLETKNWIAFYLNVRYFQWYTQLFTLQPHGLNKRQEYKSKRIHYN